MTEEERQTKIRECEKKLLHLAAVRCEAQIKLCKAISDIHDLRETMRNLGYQAPTAAGA